MKALANLGLPLLLIILMPSSAMAYIDPGTGTVLLQGIIGAIAALGVILRLYWHRLLRLLRIEKPKPQPPTEQGENTTPGT